MPSDDGRGRRGRRRGGRRGEKAAAAATAQVLQPRSSSRSPPPPAPPSSLLLFFRTFGNAARVAFAWPHGPHPRNGFRAPAPLSGRKRFAWAAAPLELEQLRALAKRSGDATINDLFLAAVSAALRRYFTLEKGGGDESGKKKKKRGRGDRVRAFVTFSLRDEKNLPATRLGNEFGLVAVDLPTHSGCPLKRLEESNRSMTRLKGTREPHGVAALLSLAGLAPGRAVQGYFLREFTKKGSIVLSNVRGPPAAEKGRSRTLAGASVLDVVVFVPQTGDLGASFGLFSFDGKVQLSLAADESLVRDPRRLIGLLWEAFEELEKVKEVAEEKEKMSDGGAALREE